MFIVGSIVPSLALDKMDRCRAMMLGSFGLGVSMLLIAALLSQAPKRTLLRVHTGSRWRRNWWKLKSSEVSEQQRGNSVLFVFVFCNV